MTDLTTYLPLAPVVLSLVVMAFTVVRLRRPMRLRVLPILFGAVGPIAATGLYLFVTRPAFNVITAVAVVLVALIVAARIGRHPKTWVTDKGPAVRRPIVPLALWAMVYLVALAVPVLLASNEGRAAGALLMLGSAGLATGAMVGLMGSRIDWARGKRTTDTTG